VKGKRFMGNSDATSAKCTSAYADRVAQDNASVMNDDGVTEYADCFASDRLKVGGGREAQHPTVTTVFE
jgi:hypothetical protein